MTPSRVIQDLLRVARSLRDIELVDWSGQLTQGQGWWWPTSRPRRTRVTVPCHGCHFVPGQFLLPGEVAVFEMHPDYIWYVEEVAPDLNSTADWVTFNIFLPPSEDEIRQTIDGVLATLRDTGG